MDELPKRSSSVGDEQLLKRNSYNGLISPYVKQIYEEIAQRKNIGLLFMSLAKRCNPTC